MSVEPPRHSVWTALFMAVAGFVDAIGFLTLNGLFASFMSGNSTQFAIGLGQESWGAAWRPGAVAALFVFGVVVGRLASSMRPWGRPLILSLEAILLGAPAVLALPGFAQGACMTIAMGAQNELMRPGGGAKLGLTYVTGTLVRLGESLADALHGAGSFSACLPVAFLWLGLVAGGAAGAASFVAFGPDALVAPASAMLILAIAATFDASRQRP